MLVTEEECPYLAGSEGPNGCPSLRGIRLGKAPGASQIRCQLRAVHGQQLWCCFEVN